MSEFIEKPVARYVYLGSTGEQTSLQTLRFGNDAYSIPLLDLSCEDAFTPYLSIDDSMGEEISHVECVSGVLNQQAELFEAIQRGMQVILDGPDDFPIEFARKQFRKTASGYRDFSPQKQIERLFEVGTYTGMRLERISRTEDVELQRLVPPYEALAESLAGLSAAVSKADVAYDSAKKHAYPLGGAPPKHSREFEIVEPDATSQFFFNMREFVAFSAQPEVRAEVRRQLRQGLDTISGYADAATRLAERT